MSGGVFRLLGALVSPLMVLYRWWRPVADRSAIADRSDDLSAAVQVSEERLQQALRARGGDLMQVEFTLAARPAGDARRVAVKDIATYVERLGHLEPHRRRMVVLGAPGSGKTVAATYLVLGLLKTWQNLEDAPRANEPVPVRVNAAGWDGQRDFTRWLIVRLGHDYRLRPNVAREMVKRGLILPVIDGLDEMDTGDSAGSRAKALLDRLNHAPWRDRPVVVMCRTTEFEELTRVRGDNGLHFGTTVTLQPLATDTVDKYLSTHQKATGTGHPGWTQVITHITDRPDEVLAICMHNPWMLGLTTRTLHHTPHFAEQLISCDTETAVRNVLFTAQVPAAIAATDEGERHPDYTEANVEKWMRSLARCLQRRRDEGRDGTAIRLDEIWEIAGINRVRILHGLVGGLVGMLVFVVVFVFWRGLGLGFKFMFEFEFGFGFGVLLLFGFVFGFGFGLVRFPRSRRMAWSVPGSSSRWRRGLKMGSPVGLVFGLVFGSLFGLLFGLWGSPDWLVSALAGGLIVGIMFGLGFGIMTGLQVDAREELALMIDGQRIVRDNIQAAVVTAIVIWLVSATAAGLLIGPVFEVVFGLEDGLLFGLEDGLLFGLMGALVDGLEDGLLFGLPVGLSVGLTAGLVTGLAAERYYLAKLVFRFTKAMPHRPDVFLDWARRNGLLRVNGTAYQFRHETYQQWIQQSHSSETGPSPSTGSNDRTEQPVS